MQFTSYVLVLATGAFIALGSQVHATPLEKITAGLADESKTTIFQSYLSAPRTDFDTVKEVIKAAGFKR